MKSDVISWILLTLFIGVFADKKGVDQGSLVLLFENVTADNAENDVSLFVNGKGNASLIATFKYMNGHISMSWKAGNYKNIFMDATRNIWIANIDETYERKFYIQSSKKLGEVELILKTNYFTPQKETAQKGNALPETNSTTVRTALQDTTKKDDALPVYAKVLIVLLVFLILMVIFIVVIMKKQHRFSRVLFKKCNSIPQPVQVTSHRDSPDSTSYQLMWEKPDDREFQLRNYIIRYCEVEIIPDGTEYELCKYLKPFESVDNILPSAESYKLSPLTPGRYYLVEIQAIYPKGLTLKKFIFKTKVGVPQPVQVTSHRDSPDSTSYKLIWDKPDDGGSPLIKYIIRYCEVEIIPDRTEYELSKYLKPFESMDNILPSAVSYKLSPLTPGRYYLVEIQAIHTQGQTLKCFIFKTKEGVPQPVQVTSHRDSPDSTSYKLMWDKPDDGGSPLMKYIIRYCEVKISPNGTEYELSKPLYPLEITPSDESCTLSPLNPGSFYQVEVQAVNTMGMSSKMFIFKTKDSAPKQAVKKDFLPVVPDLQLPVQHAPIATSHILTDETNPKLHRLSKKIEKLSPRNNDTVFTDTQSSTSNVEQNTNVKLKKTPEEELNLTDSASTEEEVALLKDSYC